METNLEVVDKSSCGPPTSIHVDISSQYLCSWRLKYTDIPNFKVIGRNWKFREKSCIAYRNIRIPYV